MNASRQHGPKIRDLAEELAVNARAVLAAAAELGIAAQNRLTRVKPADAERIRVHLRSQPATGDGNPENGA